ncbi:hypothetical protein GWI33_013559 [Rhynchophorus ferrugineus]|uniref:Uncharacterized protein n=1 Tax=Rhynchophorus ferrugineus TaxID=354439 RepID=A0A834I3I0_RHYFE|nr:hypothetical protein GWI33_013559 [Rhynchophorus ferrugineus]
MLAKATIHSNPTQFARRTATRRPATQRVSNQVTIEKPKGRKEPNLIQGKNLSLQILRPLQTHVPEETSSRSHTTGTTSTRPHLAVETKNPNRIHSCQRKEEVSYLSYSDYEHSIQDIQI